jgi:hypothetical protein
MLRKAGTPELLSKVHLWLTLVVSLDLDMLFEKSQLLQQLRFFNFGSFQSGFRQIASFSKGTPLL